MVQTRTDYELVRPDSQAWELAQQGVDCILAAPRPDPPRRRWGILSAPRAGRGSTLAQRRIAFDEYCREHRIDLGRQVLALRPDAAEEPADHPPAACGGQVSGGDSLRRAGGNAGPRGTSRGSVAAACLWVLNPGNTAMLYFTDLNRRPTALEPTAACLRAAVADARAAGAAVVQAVVPADDRLSIGACEKAGMIGLATLYYMRRRRPIFPPASRWPPGVTLTHYSPAAHPWFVETIAATYEQTLDCPALIGRRTMEEVIAGHKATGQFDPALWCLAWQGSRPVGVLLLTRHPGRDVLELAYLGLIVAARGHGLGAALLREALRILIAERIGALILAVDQANQPALRLYRRLHCRITDRRRVFIDRQDPNP